jgi:Dolichyl-phosphate-mannose-protein mannosyltransferase
MLLLVLLLSVGVGYVAARWQKAAIRPFVPVKLAGEWITTPDQNAYSGYFRTTFELPSRVKHAWVAIAPDNAFELTVNGNPAGRFYLWRPTRPFQTGLSEHGQRLVAPQPAMGLNFPREYQWTDHDNARLPVWLDIAGDLRPGKNVLCVEIEARHTAPGFCLEGAIELWSGEIIPLLSNQRWRAEPVPPGVTQFDWTHPHYDDSRWRTATLAHRAHTAPQCAFDHRVYQRPFTGRWIGSPTAATDQAVWIQGTWTVAGPVRDAFLRVLCNRTFEIFVNGIRLGPTQPAPLNFDGGNWVINDRGSWDDLRKPEVIDPDEIGSLFIGNDFLSPRHADPTYDPVATYKNQINVTTDKPNATNRSDLPGTYDPKRDLDETRRTPDKPDPFPISVPLRSLERDRAQFAYCGYDVTALLKPGENVVAVRLSEASTVEPPNWSGAIAVDGLAITTDGTEHPLSSATDWKCAAARTPSRNQMHDAVDKGPALTINGGIPRLVFRGVQFPAAELAMTWFWCSLSFGCAVTLMVGLGYLLLRRRFAIDSEIVRGWIRAWATTLIVATAVVACVAMLEVSFAEREEAVWAMQTWPWQIAAWSIAAILLAGAAVAVIGLRRTPQPQLPRIAAKRRTDYLWNAAVVVVVLASAFLRAYQLDIQPMDDDEYASVQAVIAIAQTGIPGFVPEGVYYSRSPAYHYLTAGIVAIFGQNIWALRLPSVVFGAATVWLIYWMGWRLLHNRLLGFATMVLLAVHPFEIFTSHVARFYQQQQFFALLTVYWFCLGFVTEQSQKYRYLTVAGFLVTVLSQEIAIVMAPLLLVGYFLFARDLGWKKNAWLVLAIVVAFGWIFLDWLAFQTLCLTRTEGVSPNVEAQVKPHFWQPFNLFSIFLAYSRLHLSLSLFIVADLFLGWRSRNRAFLALFVVLVVGDVFVNLLITHSSLRYLYFLFPLWALFGMEAMHRFVVRVEGVFTGQSFRRPGLLAGGLAALFYVTILVSWSPWRIVGSYDIKILPDSTGACRYVASQIRPGDKTMVTEPHPHAAFLEIGHADYDLSVPVLMDFVVLKHGKLIDRNAGAEAVGSLAQLQQVMMRDDRVWILINKEKMRTRGKNIRWEYPGARIEEYLRQNAELKYRSPFWNVYLWDASVGRHRPFRTE